MFHYVIIVMAAFAGFILAFYIWSNKKKSQKMVCPMKGNCESVVHSSYSKFFGIPVEVLGMIYYASIALGYLLTLALPEFHVGLLTYGLLVATGGAFLFSAYLTFIQIFTLKQICTWCFTSAGLSTLIAVIAYIYSLGEVTEILAQQRPLIIALHVLGMALGLGAATLADFFFFKFLKDYKISQFESEVLSQISQFIWFALALVVLTGLGLYLPQSGGYLESSKFIAKMAIVGIIIVNGAILNLVVAPRLVTMSFDKKHEHHHRPGELRRHRRLAFALGPISIISWYSAFVLGGLRSIPITALEALAIYGGIVLVGIMVGQILERTLVTHASKRM